MLGWPNESVYARVGKLGTRVDNEFADRPWPDVLLEVDAQISRLNDSERKILLAWHKDLLRPGRARECGLTVDQYRRRYDAICDQLIRNLWHHIEPAARALGTNRPRRPLKRLQANV